MTRSVWKLTWDVLQIAFWLWIWHPVRRDPAVERMVALEMGFWRMARAMRNVAISAASFAESLGAAQRALEKFQRRRRIAIGAR
jgi:hypothetical protein